MFRLAKTFLIFTLFSILVLALSGCGAAIITSTEGGPSEPVVEEGPAVDGGPLRAIEVQDVQIEVGVGSPIPVNVMVSGSWPGLCAQLALINVTQGDSSFTYELLATPEEEGCPPDMIGLPFAMRIPLNIVELPEGSYTVTVNDVSTTLDVPVTPPVEP